MTYTNDHQLKHKNKATKILGQAKTLVQEYEDKINAVIVKEGEALEACYDKHRKECAADLKERDALLKELAVNWEWIEVSAVTVARLLTFSMVPLTRQVQFPICFVP